MLKNKRLSTVARTEKRQLKDQDSTLLSMEIGNLPQTSVLPSCPDNGGQWPLRVFTMGRFVVCCNDVPLVFNGKSPRKALELLQMLIAHGGREVHTAMLMRDLWADDASGDLRNLFDNTLHRLRRLLGPVEVLNLQNGKLTLNPKHCWVDAWAFGRLSSAFIDGPSEISGAHPESGVKAAEAALRLYSGHFLQQETEYPWVSLYRDRLKSRFQRLVNAVGARLEQAGQWESAADVYVRGLEMDNLSESFYQHLMVCYQQMGEHGEALLVYRRCRELLSIVLGIAPSAKTERIRLGLLDA